MSDAYQKVLDAIPGKKKRKSGAMFAICPAHNDKEPSLKVERGDNGRIMLHCFAGCTENGPGPVLDKVGLKMSDLFEDDQSSPSENGHKKTTQYETRDIDGNLIAIHHRIDLGGGKKRVWWRLADGQKPSDAGTSPTQFPLYGTQKLATAPRSTPVVVVEGEKACDALQDNLGSLVTVLATTTGAEGTPSDEVLEVLRGKDVILWPDKDTPGRIHMRRIAESLVEIAAETRIYKWRDAPDGGDAADMQIQTEADKDDLLNDLITAKQYVPKPTITKEPHNFGEYEAQHTHLIRARIEGEGITGIRTEIGPLDRGLGGINDGLSYIVGAVTGGAKSLVGGQIALVPAWHQDKNVLLVSTEQAGIIYRDRFVHVMADIPHDRARKGDISTKEEEKLRIAGRELANLPIQIAVGDYTVTEIRNMVEDLDVDMVVIDYLQAVTPTDKRMSKWEQVANISGELRAAKTYLDIPFVMTAQASMASLTRDVKRPQVWDLAYSQEIQRDADVIMLLHDAHKAGEDGAVPGELKIFCDKFREGGHVWKTTVRFRPGQNWIEEIPTKRTQDYEIFDEV